jgi:uncharacterized protein (DUF1501 family)
MLSRRAFLQSSSVLSLSPMVPGFLARTARAAKPEPDSRVLVVIDLTGGNDGINTVVPFADEGYAKHRKALRLAKDRLVRVNDRVGLHPSLGGFGKLLEDGRLAVVQGVGYPDPNTSHGGSATIWQTARLTKEEQQEGHGWLGRALGRGVPASSEAPASFSIGTDPLPIALRGRGSVVSALNDLEDYAATTPEGLRGAISGPQTKDDQAAYVRRSLLDGYLTADSLHEAGSGRRADVVYPETELARRLGLVARVLKGGLGTRVFYTTQAGTGPTPGGYDTHARQLPTHALLLGELGGALRAFLDDLAAAKIADRVAVLVFSEFGRRVAENGSDGSAGTDHGTAGPVFLAGPGVRAGLVGEAPRLLDLDPNGNLKAGIDFRRVYATVLEDWLGLPAKAALGGAFEKFPLFRG